MPASATALPAMSDADSGTVGKGDAQTDPEAQPSGDQRASVEKLEAASIREKEHAVVITSQPDLREGSLSLVRVRRQGSNPQRGGVQQHLTVAAMLAESELMEGEDDEEKYSRQQHRGWPVLATLQSSFSWLSSPLWGSQTGAAGGAGSRSSSTGGGGPGTPLAGARRSPLIRDSQQQFAGGFMKRGPLGGLAAASGGSDGVSSSPRRVSQQHQQQL